MKNLGLIQKYIIHKTSGEPVDEGAEYFVLRLDRSAKNDPIHVEACRKAVLLYASEIATHLPELAKDLTERYGGGLSTVPPSPAGGSASALEKALTQFRASARNMDELLETDRLIAAAREEAQHRWQQYLLVAMEATKLKAEAATIEHVLSEQVDVLNKQCIELEKRTLSPQKVRELAEGIAQLHGGEDGEAIPMIESIINRKMGEK